MKHTFIRFLMIGILNTLVGLSVMYFLLHIFQYSYWVSTFVGNCIGAIVSYFLNRKFTFKSNNTHIRSMIRFALVIGCCYFLAYYLGMRIIKDVLYFVDFHSQKLTNDLAVLTGTGLYTILNFLGQKHLVFNPIYKRHVQQ